MNRNALTSVVAVLAAFGIGLGWSWFAQPRGGVAVVDLDEVAHRLGRDSEMQQSLQGQADRIQQQLAAIEQNALNQLEEVRKGLGNAPTQEATGKFLQMRSSAQQQLTQLKQKAEQQLGQHRQQIVNTFREEAKPIAAQVAKKQGFTTVVTKNDAIVFLFDSGVDITDEVVQLMSSQRKQTAAPAPGQPVQAQPLPAAGPASPSPGTSVQRVTHEEVQR